ncbi:RluA family pseudouridine synthase [Metabacillus sp. GX 13764]|uniref:RluA family pseudouridine synthase n=1 Tax=Metabacillus kandeliae TaxID=2900151 RepID=UPI001E2BBCEC|nr:RluA family pseudouridine synthase [Metabacillus kandeliae]MCD7035191.1 RluA family pseudouridine synthase [Metabacillus kandeliae]
MKIKGEWLEYKAELKNGPVYLNEYLQKVIGASKANILEWRKTGAIQWNNEILGDFNPLVQDGDQILLHVFAEETEDLQPEYKEIEVLFEDEHLLIANKPAGMATHPNEQNQKGTFANALAFYYQMTGQHCRVRQVHRLDQDTSGAIVFAKHALAQTLLDKALQEHLIKRTYIALAEGRLHRKKGTFNDPIGKDRHHPTRKRVSENGQAAVTHYEVIKGLREQKLTIVKLQLETGRTHQIRVHLSHAGNPIAGDELYGSENSQFSSQALHAAEINLTHPFTGEALTIRAPFPEEMADVIGDIF